jgi:hypothetical protein
MTHAARLILIVTLMFSLGAAASAQETTTEETTTETTPATATVTATADGDTDTIEAGDTVPKPAGPLLPVPLRDSFTELLRQHPYELSSILILDPNLMLNEQFMTGYPEVAKFIAAHPEIPRNPRFYLAEFRDVETRSSAASIFEPLAAIFGITLFAYGITWLIRTFIEQKRWTRLSRQQSEVHNKILDRFGTSAELLDYVRSEAGSKFLESAPIPLHAERPAQSAPMSKIMWTIQAGIVAVAGALGLMLVGLRFEGENASGFFSLGAIAFCVGGGFIVSAFVSLFLSRRLGLWQGPAGNTLDEPGQVR